VIIKWMQTHRPPTTWLDQVLLFVATWGGVYVAQHVWVFTNKTWWWVGGSIIAVSLFEWSWQLIYQRANPPSEEAR